MSLTANDPIAVYYQLLEAWNKRDAVAFASLFIKEGMATGFDGSMMHGTEEIGQQLKEVFSHHQTARYVAIIRRALSIAPTVFIIQAVAGMIPPGEKEIKSEVNTVQSVVLQHNGSDWMICLLQNTPAAFHERPQDVEQLTGELQEVADKDELIQYETGV